MGVHRGPAASLTIQHDGASLSVVPGETIAAALIAHGVLAQGRGRDGAPRGHFCGMGVCHECLVSVHGRGSVRACLEKVEGGMRVASQRTGLVPLGNEIADASPIPEGPIPVREVDVLVVGSGPAGLRAALAAAQAGARVLIVDERPAPGGQYFKQNGSVLAPTPDAQMEEGAGLIRAVRAAGVEIASGMLAWGVERRGDASLIVSTIAAGCAGRISPRILVIATGAFERPVQVKGWTLPGVMTTGGAQTLLRSYGVTPGRRVLLAGNGPLNIQVARELLAVGVEEVTLVEAARAPWLNPLAAGMLAVAGPGLAFKGLADLARLAAGGARLRFAHRLVAVEGQHQAEAAIIRSVDGGPAERIAVDAVCAAEGFAPACDLPRLLGLEFSPVAGGDIAVRRGDDGSTEQTDVFVVGEAGGFGGAHIAGAMGELAGLEAARRLGLAPAGDGHSARAALSRHRGFQRRLWNLFAASNKTASDETMLVCRCEAKSFGELRNAVASHSIRDLATLKRLTRAGMGRCQGRYCLPALRELVGAPSSESSLPAPQAPVRPVPLAALAAEKSEWGGHRRVDLPEARSVPGEPLPFHEAATVIVGGGIAGLSTALFLARAGEDVVVLDRGPVNAGASGGNAGSLHAQLLSFDHGAKAEAGGGPAARTLPLQLESIALWRSLESELGVNFEIAVTGGVMVAETEAHLRFLDAKTRVERAQGVDCEVIGRDDLRRLEPALDERFVGAAFCPQEGKINPLVATHGVHEAAIAAGARVFVGVEVKGVSRVGNGFALSTNRGDLRAGRVVNCAGGFASRIGAMLGVTVPVHGAPLQMIVTEAAEPIIKRLVAHADRHLTLKQASNGNFIIGGGWTASLDPVRRHPRPLLDSIEGNLWVAQHVVPALRKLHVLRTWAAMNINIDGAPILGEHPAIPCFYNCVTSNGYTLGPVMGQITARLIRGEDSGRDISAFSIARFG